MFKILDGKALASKIRQNIKEEVNKLTELDLTPTLAVIQIGDDKASSIYVKNKSKACEEVGINFLDYKFAKDTSYITLSMLISDLNNDNEIDGILIQQPIPNHLKGIEQLISPTKDVDGFTYNNIGKYVTNNSGFIPCTTLGILALLKEYNIEVEGKHIVIIGRSNIVGKPTLLNLLNNNATVTICHSKTKNLKDITLTADILITAIGKSNFIDSNYIKDDIEAIIDVGINRDKNNKITGDCDLNSIINRWIFQEEEIGDNMTHYITPVPGGVGPLTIAFLLNNIVEAVKQYNL